VQVLHLKGLEGNIIMSDACDFLTMNAFSQRNNPEHCYLCWGMISCP
jgi:hypothetical protein